MRVLLLLATGCAMTEERFERVGFHRWCLQSAACDPAVDVEACELALESTDRTDCVYDSEAADACFEALREVTCLQVGLEVSVIDVPAPCANTWECGVSP